MLKVREYFLYISIYFGVIIVISTEFLSFFNYLNHFSIKLLWLIIFVTALIILSKKKFFNISYEFLSHIDYKILYILLVFLLTFITALIYPPNSLDAMSYHLPKVMNWIQNSNLSFYPTNDLRQLSLAPFSEFALLHLYLIINADNFSNLVQWYSMIVSCLAVTLISKELGCNIKFQIFSALFCATLPMGILQSNSTQTDYVTSMWLSIMIYFLIKYIKLNQLKSLFYFSLALGLGIFTKGTFYIFALPFCCWLGLYILIKNKKHFIYALLIPVIILIINSGHFSRNINLFGNPLGLNVEDNIFLNKKINPTALIGNTVKNFGLNLSLPSESLNRITSEKITQLLQVFNISTFDPSYTKIYRHGYYIPFSFYESTAPNTIHFLIIFLSFFIFILKKFSIDQKNYLYSVLATFILFSLLLIWDSRNNRYLLCFFVISAPIMSYILNRFELTKLTNVLAIFLIIYSLPYLLFNKSRPLIGDISYKNNKIHFKKAYYFNEDRFSLYFIANRLYSNPDDKINILNAANTVKTSNCFVIGLHNVSREYPLWVALKTNDTSKDRKFKIYNVKVDNISSTLGKKIYGHEKICKIINLSNN